MTSLKNVQEFLGAKLTSPTESRMQDCELSSLCIQDDWGEASGEGPRKSLGAPRKLLGKVTKVTKVTNSYKIECPRRS